MSDHRHGFGGPRRGAGRGGPEKVGELRPSQILFSYGVGSIIELPSLSMMVMGLDDWPSERADVVVEDRLLAAVRARLGHRVATLRLPPIDPDEDGPAPGRLGAPPPLGVPVSPFPRWGRCPACNVLAPLDRGVFEFRSDWPFRSDKGRFVHETCARGNRPTVVPAPFLLACEHGHIDDFPWSWFVHRGQSCEAGGPLMLRKLGVSDEAADLLLECAGCDSKRRMSDAFGEQAEEQLPRCRGREAHLRRFAEHGCDAQPRTLLVGASNAWFPITLSSLALPRPRDGLRDLVERLWDFLTPVTSREVLGPFLQIPTLGELNRFPEDAVWAAVCERRARGAAPAPEEPPDLKVPEWRLLTAADPGPEDFDFQAVPVPPPSGYGHLFVRTVRLERLREVRALIGFARIEYPGDATEGVALDQDMIAPLSRRDPTWVPATEVRGEGIFLQFNEDVLAEWCGDEVVKARAGELHAAHTAWGTRRKIDNPQAGFPGVRYVLLHSVAHALMRELALEGGYGTASIRERIYARDPRDEGGPMAGILLYTSAPDSEGTLGGLVQLGEPATLGRLMEQALGQAALCASDPLCAESDPDREGLTRNGAACHACLHVPETSCERGNAYLDRTLLVETLGWRARPFFGRGEPVL